MKRGPKPREPILRFLEKIEKGDNGCWMWTGAVSSSGYSSFWDGEKYVTGHSFSYRHFQGEHNEQTLDHVCDHVLCVNPNHLEPKSHKANNLRGNSVSAHNARKTHCVQGHPFSGDNLYEWKNRRSCRTCRKAAMERYYRRSLS